MQVHLLYALNTRLSCIQKRQGAAAEVEEEVVIAPTPVIEEPVVEPGNPPEYEPVAEEEEDVVEEEVIEETIEEVIEEEPVVEPVPHIIELDNNTDNSGEVKPTPTINSNIAVRVTKNYKNGDKVPDMPGLIPTGTKFDELISDRITSQEELDDYELILNQETLDIFNFIIERDPLPEELKTPVMQQLQDFAATNPIGTTDDGIEGYAQAKKNMSN